MTKKELIEALDIFPDDMVVVISDDYNGGWSNIDYIIREDGSATIDIVIDKTPIFSGE